VAEAAPPVAADRARGAGPLRIAYVIGSLGTGGAEYQLFELVRHLDRRRFAPTVFSLSAGGRWASAMRAADIAVVEIPQRHRLEARRLWRLRRLLGRLRPTLLHTILWPGNSYGRLAALGLGIPVVIAAERNVIRRPPWQRTLERALDRTTTAYLANTEAIVEELTGRGGLPAVKMHVVYNGIDLGGLPGFSVDRRPGRRRLGVDGERRLVATVGRLEPQKDVATFVAAMARVATRVADVDFLIVGEGGERSRLEAAVQTAGIADRTRFLGLRDDVPAILAAVEVMVLASRWEGMPNVVLEAMATGAVTVATDVGACRTLLDDGAGRVVAVGDDGAIATAVCDLLADPAARERTAERARRRVVEELSTERMAAATVALYERLLVEGGR
jgi:glycosyltransferase involved in cell wall biosynthesis